MKRAPKYEVFKSSGQWWFRLRSPNGQIQHPSEGYGSKAKALRAVAAVKRNAALAEVVVVG